jgi:hypothetical protein
MTAFQLQNIDARLLYLALHYHLARPGSELDPQTKQPVEHGLREVADALEPQLEQAVATVDLADHQRRRVVSAIAGAVNELKTYPLFDELPDGGRRSSVAGFDPLLRRLFPEVAEDAGEAPQLAAHLIALRRRLEATGFAPEPAKARSKGSGWRFWQRH